MIDTASGLLEIDVAELFAFEPAAEAKAAHAEVCNLWREADRTRAAEDYLKVFRACEAAANAFAAAGNSEQQVRAWISAGGCLTKVVGQGAVDLLVKATECLQTAARLAGEADLDELEALAKGYVTCCNATSLGLLARSAEPPQVHAAMQELEAESAASQERLLAVGKAQAAAAVQACFANGLCQVASVRGSRKLRERAQAEAEKAFKACRDAGFDEGRLGYVHLVLGMAMQTVAGERKDADLLKRAGEELAAGAVRLRTIPGQGLAAAMAALGVGAVCVERADWTGEAKGWRAAGRWYQDAAERFERLGRTAEQQIALKADRDALAKWVEHTSEELDKSTETVVKKEVTTEEGEGRIAQDAAAVATDVDAGADFAAAVAHAREAVHVVASRLQERLDEARRFMPTEVADREELVRQVDEALALGVELRVGGERSTKLMLQRGSALTWRIGSSGAAGFRKNAVEVSVPGLQEPEVATQQANRP